MSTSYHVYKGDNAGGPIDYTTIVATTASLSYAAGAMPVSAITRWAVRAFDTVTTLEETNIDATVTVITDGSGNDITNRPSAPQALTGRPTAAGGSTLHWMYPPNAPGGVPTGFHVYRGTPTVSYASAIGTVAFTAGRATYSFNDTGLSDEVAYQYAVRAYNATAEEANTTVIVVTGEVNGPTHVDSLAAVVIA